MFARFVRRLRGLFTKRQTAAMTEHENNVIRELRKVEVYFDRRYLKNARVTQEACDNRAVEVAGSPVVPVPCQGLCSYSVFAGKNGDVVVSFREETISEIDLTNIDIAFKIHGAIVPKCESKGSLGPLKILVMPKITGTALSDAAYKQPGKLPPHRRLWIENTTRDLADFFAKSWNSARNNRVDRKRLVEFRDFAAIEMRYFSASLDITHQRVLDKIIKHLPSLFSLSYPFVLTHLDMLPWNILVHDNGHVSGVIDWWDAQNMPFGIALQGRFFNLLGYMDEKKEWHFYPEHRELETLFWSTFHQVATPMTDKQKETMELAQMVGLYLRYGSTWDESLGDSGAYRPSREGDEKMAYLNAAIKWAKEMNPYWAGDMGGTRGHRGTPSTTPPSSRHSGQRFFS